MADTESSWPERTGPNGALIHYISERDETFRQLHQLKMDGLKNPKADEHFAAQRSRADNADDKQNKKFYDMTQKVGEELNRATRALDIKPNLTNGTPMILDLCMAPGGFSAAALAANPNAKLRAITLPAEHGGHPVIIPNDGTKVIVQHRDITLLAGVMGVPAHEIPPDHPDAANFRHDQPFADSKFDLVFCDGQVLRTHERHRQSYRERHEATRLLTSQLVLALQRIRDGGTLIVLLHRVEQWNTARLLQTMNKIAEIKLFKPRHTWGPRGSFYLVAEKVRPHGVEAERAVRGWKDAWRRTTFDIRQPSPQVGDGDEASPLEDHDEEVLSEEAVQDFLREFGPTLIRKGRPIWQIQLEALRRAPWNRGAQPVRNIHGAWRAQAV
ncbi:hypothetical protein BR93DRAFT_914895 [Coniochaeta sp. PMI_546]|nr:hypothetical protein BR93DRAFT_914895 [Coniochaeta sp. PMI_546]